MSNFLIFLKRHWPWGLLALAALIFTTFYVPSFFMSAIDTETVMLAVFYHDVVEQHHPISDWGWGGCSDVFPDVSVTFLLNFIFRDSWWALKGLVIFYFVSWLAATASLAIVLKRPNRLALFSILFLLWVGLICNFAFPFEWGLHILNPLFEPMYHSGTGLLTMVCLTLILRQITGGRTAGFCWLFVLAFVGGTSDILFLVVFLGPALTSMGLLALAFRQDWKKYAALGLNLFLAGVASIFLGPYCFPIKTASGSFVHLNFQDAYATLGVVLGEMSRPEHHFFAFMGILDVLTVLGGIAGLLFFCFSPKGQRMSPMVVTLLVFCSSSILLDWFATLFTGVYQGMYTNRYLAVALVIPMFTITFALHSIVQWSPRLEKLVTVVIAVFASCIAFIPQDPHPDYLGIEADLPFLKSVMKEYHIKVGLADYWKANLCTFLSHWDVPLRPEIGDGTYYTWFTSLLWIGKGLPAQERPHFRMIYQADPHFAQVFGQPDKIVYSPAGSPIWIYSEARAIYLNDYFNIFSNQFLDNGRTLRISPATLPSGTGTLQNGSLIAVQRHDIEGYLNGGPAISFKPGRYHLSFQYICLLTPTADKIPLYDIVIHCPGTPDQVFNPAPLPCPGLSPQVFGHDITVTNPEQTFEWRVIYRASGTIRLDSLEATYLGP